MKFYQAIALVMLSIICTTTIFGAEATTLSEVINGVSKITWRVIDDFSGEEEKENGKIVLKNDDFYEKTAQTQLYFTDHSIPKIYKYSISITTFIFNLLPLAISKVFPRILPNKIIPPLCFLASIIGFGICSLIKFQPRKTIWIPAYVRIRNIDQPRKISTKVSTKYYHKIDSQQGVIFQNKVGKYEKFKHLEYRTLPGFLPLPTTKFTPGLSCNPKFRINNKRCYNLEDNGIISVYLTPSDHEGATILFPGQEIGKYTAEKLSRLPTQTKVTKFTMSSRSSREKFLVTVNKDGSIYAFTLKKREDLYKIMRPSQSSPISTS